MVECRKGRGRSSPACHQRRFGMRVLSVPLWSPLRDRQDSLFRLDRDRAGQSHRFCGVSAARKGNQKPLPALRSRTNGSRMSTRRWWTVIPELKISRAASCRCACPRFDIYGVGRLTLIQQSAIRCRQRSDRGLGPLLQIDNTCGRDYLTVK